MISTLLGSDWPTRLAWLLIGLVAGGLAGHLWRLGRRVIARFRYHLKSAADKTLDRIVWETYTSHIWRKPPEISPQSVSYIRRNWQAFDPSRVHPRADEPSDQMKMTTLVDLVRRSGTYLGRHIALCAHLGVESQFGAEHNGLQTRILQLISREDKATLAVIYCRVTVEASRQFDREHLVWVNGVVLAAGAVDGLEGGVLNAVYILASFVDQLTLKLPPEPSG